MISAAPCDDCGWMDCAAEARCYRVADLQSLDLDLATGIDQVASWIAGVGRQDRQPGADPLPTDVPIARPSPRRAARFLNWAGRTRREIADLCQVSLSDIEAWAQADRWDEPIRSGWVDA